MKIFCCLKPLFFLFLLAMICSCSPAEQVEKQYLFLGHPYDWNFPDRIDARLEKFDFSSFDQLWLGGDVCSKATEKRATITYLDSLFDLGSRRLHWALGNHDIQYGNLHYITEKTGRKTFYATYFDGISLLVLNTNLFWYYEGDPPQEQCEEKEAQMALIRQITDTITQSSHLIILHHHALFNELKLDSIGRRIEAFNMDPLHIRATCDPDSDFTSRVYPMLKKVQKRGVQVILIGGDLGMKAKEFAFRTDDGIWLLGSGINNSVKPAFAPDYVTNFDPDKILVLKHKPEKREISWEFIPLWEAVSSYGFAAQ